MLASVVLVSVDKGWTPPGCCIAIFPSSNLLDKRHCFVTGSTAEDSKSTDGMLFRSWLHSLGLENFMVVLVLGFTKSLG